MLQRERRRDESREYSGGESASSGYGAARAEAQGYYGAVDDAISRALSVNSVEFNEQVQQENGQ